MAAVLRINTEGAERKHGDKLVIIQVRDIGSFYKGNENRGDEKHSDSGYVLKVNVRIKVGYKRKRGVKSDSKIFGPGQ